MDIPRMLRQIAAGRPARGDRHGQARHRPAGRAGARSARRRAKRAAAAAAADGAVAICQLKRFVADADLASAIRTCPPCEPPTRQAGGDRRRRARPGLAAAYYLAQRGHACTLFDDQRAARRPAAPASSRPKSCRRDVLDAEIAAIAADRHRAAAAHARRARPCALADLRDQFDAVLIACGAAAKDQAAAWDLPVGPRGIVVEQEYLCHGHGRRVRRRQCDPRPRASWSAAWPTARKRPWPSTSSSPARRSPGRTRLSPRGSAAWSPRS